MYALEMLSHKQSSAMNIFNFITVSKILTLMTQLMAYFIVIKIFTYNILRKSLILKKFINCCTL